MAKKKATSAAPSKPAKKKPSKKKPSKKKGPSAKTAAKHAAGLCCEDIGNTAGKVWQALSDSGEQTAAALKKSVDAPGDLVLAAVGWLAREEKLVFHSTGRSVKISLK